MRFRSICKPRGAALATLVLLPVVGAAVGAGTHAQPAKSFVAQATLAVDLRGGLTTNPRSERDAVRYLAGIATLPDLLATAAAAAGTSLTAIQTGADIRVVPDDALDLVHVDARATSSEGAISLANAVALQAAGLARQTVLGGGSGRIVLGDFEGSDDGWGVVSGFGAAPRSIEPVRGPAKFGSWFLRVVCPATGSCGPGVSINADFLKGSSYTAQAWVRSSSIGQVILVLGSGPGDFGASARTRLSPHWQELTAVWTPRADTPTAEVAVETTAGRKQTYDMDGVSLVEPSGVGLPSPGAGEADQAGAFALARSATVLPAAVISQTSSSNRWHTVAWAAIGALLGLVTALTALGVGDAARRRQQA